MLTKEVAHMRANVFQMAAHEAVGQKRKYTYEPYYTHPQAVAHILSSSVPHATTDMIIAAYLHDTVEDTGVTLDLIGLLFGDTVKLYVDGLTEREYPGLNRAARKQLEAERLAACSPEVQTIKLCDMIHNTVDITKNDPNFANVYMREKRFLLDVGLRNGDAGLWQRADTFVKQWYEEKACKALEEALQ